MSEPKRERCSVCNGTERDDMGNDCPYCDGMGDIPVEENPELAALRRSHAEAVEAAVREIRNRIISADDCSIRAIEQIIRKHLGPAAVAGEKGE